jgi:hypothetical protein
LRVINARFDARNQDVQIRYRKGTDRAWEIPWLDRIPIGLEFEILSVHLSELSQ